MKTPLEQIRDKIKSLKDAAPELKNKALKYVDENESLVLSWIAPIQKQVHKSRDLSLNDLNIAIPTFDGFVLTAEQSLVHEVIAHIIIRQKLVDDNEENLTKLKGVDLYHWSFIMQENRKREKVALVRFGKRKPFYDVQLTEPQTVIFNTLHSKNGERVKTKALENELIDYYKNVKHKIISRPNISRIISTIKEPANTLIRNDKKPDGYYIPKRK
jgi:hypothetical protein